MSGEKNTERNKIPKKRPSELQRRRTRIAAAAAVILVLVLAQLLHGNSEGQRYERYRQQAADSYQKGEYDQALSDLRKAEAIRSSEDVLMLMADCYEAQGNWELALETLRKMDRSDVTATERIAALEQRRMQQQGEGLRVIAGENFPATATELDLRGRDLGNGVLQEVLQLHALTQLSLADNRIDDLSGLLGLGAGRSGFFLGAAGAQCEEHHGGQQQSDGLFHFIVSFFWLLRLRLTDAWTNRGCDCSRGSIAQTIVESKGNLR